jgi:cytidine deaminase
MAYVFKSLKLPEEITTLRRLYGSAFFVISIHSHPEARRRALAERIKESHADADFKDKQHELAERLVAQDEYEGGSGQNVRSAFPEADYFTATDKPEDLKASIRRLINTIFRHPFVTPSKLELAMAHARTASMRSADLSRQIGAAIINDDGDLIAVGCNDVPRPGGGQYFEGESDDSRDYLLSYDPNDKFKQYVISEFLGRMKRGWLAGDLANMTPEELFKRASRSKQYAFLDESRVDNLIEFGRIMHAEMAAITDAARRGVSLKGTTLVCTTFPCHMCARLIIGSGITRVYYIEPYTKSLTQQLYSQQIVVDPEVDVSGRVSFQPFFGVAPRRFFDLFTMKKQMRKDSSTGKVLPMNREGQPRVEILNTAYVNTETSIAFRVGQAIDVLERQAKKNKANRSRKQANRKKQNQFKKAKKQQNSRRKNI